MYKKSKIIFLLCIFLLIWEQIINFPYMKNKLLKNDMGVNNDFLMELFIREMLKKSNLQKSEAQMYWLASDMKFSSDQFVE